MTNESLLTKTLGKFLLFSMLMMVVIATAISCSPVSASELTASVQTDQGAIDLIAFIEMVWAARDDLAWYELLVFGVFAVVPIASAFTSLTPTPKSGTLWGAIYGFIELTALKFYRSKDKEVDTEVRKATGKPLQLKAEESTVDIIGNELRGIVVDTARQSLVGRIGLALSRIFK